MQPSSSGPKRRDSQPQLLPLLQRPPGPPRPLSGLRSRSMVLSPTQEPVSPMDVASSTLPRHSHPLPEHEAEPAPRRLSLLTLAAPQSVVPPQHMAAPLPHARSKSHVPLGSLSSGTRGAQVCLLHRGGVPLSFLIMGSPHTMSSVSCLHPTITFLFIVYVRSHCDCVANAAVPQHGARY